MKQGPCLFDHIEVNLQSIQQRMFAKDVLHFSAWVEAFPTHIEDKLGICSYGTTPNLQVEFEKFRTFEVALSIYCQETALS